MDAVGQGHVDAAADGEGHAVIAFFRAEVDGFRVGIEHHRAEFQVITRAYAACLGTVIGIFEPVAFHIQARRGFPHFQIQVSEVLALLNGAAHRERGSRDGSQRREKKDIQLFHVLCLIITLRGGHLNNRFL